MQNINPLVNKKLTEEQLGKYIIQKNQELDKDWSDRTNGVDNRIGQGKKIAGYDSLREFFEGDQWSYFKEDGTPVRVYNYCRTTVLNYTSFLANEPPEDDVPPKDNLDEIEVARSEEVERLLAKVKRDNEFPVQFADAVQNQSLLGDCFIFGPYIEWVKVENTDVPRIKFKSIKRVESVRILWSDEDFEDYDGFILNYRISVKKAERIYSEQMKERGMETLQQNEPEKYSKESGMPMVTVQIYWDETYMEVLINNQVIDFVKHDWGFIPGIFVKNFSHPTRPWGVSDIEDMLDSQVEYNEAVCATRGKINQVAVPHIFYAGEGEPVEYQAGQAQMIKLGPNDRLFPDPMGQSTAPFDVYIQNRKNDIHQLSMISEIFYGGAMTAKATGRALSVLMQGVNNKVKLKQQRWKTALQRLNRNILRLVEIYYPSGKFLVQGTYNTDIFFPSILIRNVTEEINKFNMKLQSQQTTMKNLGIPSPKEEQKVMKREWSDMSLAIETSRNPTLRMQLQQMMAQRMRQQAQQQGGEQPQLTEEQGGATSTKEESLPMSAPNVPSQAPTTGEGEVGLKGARGT